MRNKLKLLQHKDALFSFEVRITELEYTRLPIEQQLDFLEAGSQLTDQQELPMVDERLTMYRRAERVNDHIEKNIL
ncbi:MAG TPA: hypothetical protein VNQ80_04955 [Parapedobacter sp.]|uniref:hypothetical protein n=1 Tax=Parapedobacter sp. TaxID=1958893 RepID=UPI002C04F20F|nr:hypothetical protein [Parapedobacter sp.]HWK56658.1 hypothetical protein [Parapedobacter sp.]